MVKPNIRLSWWLALVATLAGCSKSEEPTTMDPVLVTGTVKQAIGSCPLVGTGGIGTGTQQCTLDSANVAADATVYEAPLTPASLPTPGPFDVDTVDTNYDAREMCVAQSHGAGSDDRRSAIKWNLSVVPANTIVTAATLTLRVSRGGGYPVEPVLPAVANPTVVGIHRIQSGVQDWTESGVTAGTIFKPCCTVPNDFNLQSNPQDGFAADPFLCGTCPGGSIVQGRHGGPCGLRTTTASTKVSFPPPPSVTTLRYSYVDTPTTDYVAAASDTDSVTSPNGVPKVNPGLLTFFGGTVDDDVRAWLANSATNRGWVIIAESPVDAPPVVIYSSETQTGNGPTLLLSYRKAPGQACTLNTQCALTSGASGACVGGFCCNVASCNDSKSCTDDACAAGTGVCSSTPNSANCNDLNACTDDVCQPANVAANPTTGCVITNDNTNNCSDGLFCNGGETCVSGTCTAGTAPCTVNTSDANCATSCNEGTDTCNAADPNGTGCNDSNVCTSSDQCTGGVCGGTNNAVACNDGLFCNGTDTCSGGSCGHSGDPCAANVGDADSDCSESCNEGTDTCIANDPDSSACNDGNVCTSGDKCTGGVCGGTNNTLACDDGLFCTGTDTCSGGSCGHTGDPCAANVGDADSDCSESCNEGTDTCTANDPNSSSCNDGNICTSSDQCTGGVCGGTNNTVSCNDSLFCNGTDTCGGGTCNHTGDPCSGNVGDADSDCSESCNEGTDTCTANDPNLSACNDGTFCNGNDTCNASGSCANHAGNPCTVNPLDANCATSCNEGGLTCNSPDPDGTGCNDSTFCNGADTCQSGTCSGHTGDPCPLNTTDNDCSGSCNEGTDSCTANDPNLTGCNDGTFCNGADTCNASGVCFNHAGNPCPGHNTGPACNDSCNEASANCTANDANLTACNDSVFCNGADTCNASGVCFNHAGNPCPGHNTGPACNDSCNEASANCTANDANLTPCNDGTFCNGNDTCNASGVCFNHAGNPCSGHNTGPACNDSCNEASANCTANDANLTPCNDGTFCNGNDTCNASGVCFNHAGNPCPGHNTGPACNDSCNEASANCTANDANLTPCNDGTFCNGTDTCNTLGVCFNHAGNPCLPLNTTDGNCKGSCNEASANCSANDTNGTSCSDGLTCNSGESCATGVCTGGSGINCSAFADDCHNGVCNEPGGCAAQNKPNGTLCTDDNLCTTTDACQSGSCIPGPALGCNDSNVCTTDGCNPATGCTHSNLPNGTACTNDGNVCTIDTCQGGFCNTAMPNTTPCGVAPSCSGVIPNAQAIPAVTCNSGTCPAQNPVPCGATTPCNVTGTACQGTCASDSDCTPTFFCNLTTNLCEGDHGIGGACSRTQMCLQSPQVLTCVDSVCCTSTCGGGSTTDCQTCNGTSPGTCTPQNATACSDGLFCNGPESCVTGVCTNSGVNPCQGADGDGNCAESCNEAADNCAANDPNGSACNDGAFCNVGETCQAGVCTGGGVKDCSAFTNQCNTGVCNETLDQCTASPISGTSCTDDNVCTTTDQCNSGVCQPGPALSCDDGNACKADACVPGTGAGTGCTHTNVVNGTPCTNDGNACTVDTCQGGFCNTAVPNGTPCGAPASCSGTIPSASAIAAVTCNAGNCPAQNPVSCGATTPCNPANTACQGACASDVDCPTTFFCNTTTSLCEVDHGIGGGCSRTAMCQQSPQVLTCVDTVCCTSACGGGVATDCQTCNGTSPGTCTNQTGTSCSDGLFCNGADTCAAGACTTHAGNPCTGHNTGPNCNDSCNEAADNCSASDANGTTCNDGLFCTVGETCNGSGVCGGSTPRDCSSSGNQCNTGSCNEATDACVATPLSGIPCDDANSCTNGDTCTNGTCTGSIGSCDDNNPCTTDTCNTSGGCIHTPNTVNCNDNNACTTNDKCNGAGACVGGAAPNCNDSNPCTDDSCAPATGCVNAANTANCDDGNACTTADKCTNKVCVGGTPPVCNDGNPCTDDSCAPATGCVTTANTANCDDGNACTTADKCANRVCVGGPAPVCNDGNPCTVDSCSPAQGCVTVAGNQGDECHAKNGVCDVPEVCSGASPACPADGFANGTQCAAGSCTGGVETHPALCDGSGPICPTATTKPCAPYVCDATACKTTCTSESDCTLGNFCASGQCSSKGPPGTQCTSASQCQSNFCVDNVCCNSDCTGQCEACNLTGSPGTCSAVTGTPVTPRSACGGNGTGCDGACDGVTTQSCTMPGTSKECRAPSCTGGTATLQEFCDGSGACAAVRTQDCAPGICGAIACEGCTTDESCSIPNQFCRAGVCTPRSPKGDTCSRDGECSSLLCVDGVCCDGDCTGQCEACNVAGKKGTCSPVTTAPVGNRPACNGAGTSGSVCGGVCDGKDGRSCTYPGLGVVCRSPDCRSSRATLVAFCDGNGSCPSLEEQDCTTGCDGTFCANPDCVKDSDCNGGLDAFCSAGVCVPKKSNGGTCVTGAECVSGRCVDGFCCSTACLGQCQACDVAGSEGTCTTVTGASHGSRLPCAGDGSACRGQCDGATADRCIYPGSAQACGSPGKCQNGVATLGTMCRGDGSCGPFQQQDCGTLGCDAIGVLCAGNCTVDGDCAPIAGPGDGGLVPAYCSGGICQPSRPNGALCGSPTQCESGHCIDGVCCETACNGTCESCNQVGAIGVCTAIDGAPRSGRPACQGSGTCGGFCDGTNRAACRMPGTTTSCGVGVCLNGFSSDTPTCNANGVCLGDPSPTQCYPFACNPTTPVCITTCMTDDDCAIGTSCRTGGCKAPTPPDAGTDGGPDAGIDASSGAGGAGGRAGTGGRGAGGGAGTGGRAGSSGAGGRAAGGNAGSIGMGAGGTSSLDGGTTGPDAGKDGGGTPPTAGSGDEGSCGCRVVGRGADDWTGLFAAAGGIALVVARRRRPARASGRSIT